MFNFDFSELSLHEYVQGFVTGGRRDRRVVPEARLIRSPNQTILQFIQDPQEGEDALFEVFEDNRAFV